jgi:signal transduction histidine kinase/DNA-binding NarL/FixJ family response regulator
MKTLLVISDTQGLAEAIRAVVDAGRFRVVYQSELRAGDVLVSQGRVDACILDAELNNIRPIRTLETVRRWLPACPILIYANSKQWEWEEEAYLLGVGHILTKPVRAKLLNSLLDRILISEMRVAERPVPALRSASAIEPKQVEANNRPSQKTLEVLRSFSALLPHSLSTESILKQFLLLLRETVAVNRAAIFLVPSPEMLSQSKDVSDAHRLRSACTIGLQQELLQHFALSLNSGVGGHIAREGRILRRDSEAVYADPEMRKEFELLGSDVALPILDRETLMGVAFFDCRVTGESLTNEELALVFYMLEGLGMAIKNTWLHDQVATNQEMMGDVLRQLSSGCVVIGRDLAVHHANKMARDYFTAPGRRGELEFSDLPQVLGSKVFEALNTGIAIPPFKYRPPNGGETVYRITISPFQKQGQGVPSAVLLLVDDVTQSERLQKVEIEAANLRMVKKMAERLAHEVGNAIVPLSTHQQLFAQQYKDPEFRDSLEAALADGVKRIARLGQQMLFLAQDRTPSGEPISVAKLIEEAFREAQKHHGEQPVFLQFETGGQPLMLAGDRAGLKHALAEIMLNALQANTPSPKVKVSTRSDDDANGGRWVHIEVQDTGTGFTPEASQKGSEPFFTTRNVGLGLGLTVSRKIIETHQGKIEIARPREGQSGTVTISLPLVSAQVPLNALQ